MNGEAATGEPAVEPADKEGGIRWRSIALELATIIAGVLIALAADRLVRDFDDRQDAAEARANLRVEIGTNLGKMQSRLDAQACVLRRLDEIAAYLSSARDGRRPPRLSWIGRPHTWTMQDARWQAAASAGRASLLSRDEQAQFAFVYAGTREFARLEEEEQDAWAQLRALSELSKISDVQDASLVAALQQARYAAWLLSVSGGQTRDAAARLGARPILNELRGPQSVCLASATPFDEALRRLGPGRVAEPR
ncbi:MAG TPA: hypothetical protein VEW26_10545 [Allosphingosinicella sp.]|nr:hypothetical protein [Allosphingosinicella sp.]